MMWDTLYIIIIYVHCAIITKFYKITVLLYVAFQNKFVLGDWQIFLSKYGCQKVIKNVYEIFKNKKIKFLIIIVQVTGIQNLNFLVKQIFP